MKKILIVEDDPVQRKIIGNIVRSMGHVPCYCSTGKIALVFLEDNPDVDLLFTDIVMPEMDGIALVKAVRGMKKFDSLPIIVISGIVDASEISELLDFGVVTFLPKPLNTGDIKKFVLDYLQ